MASASTSNQLVRVTPSKIEFPCVMHQSITTSLHLKNIASNPVAFKIKTTAPKNYLVRPSTGVIPPDQSVEIQIILQPLQSDPSNATDRFLVQATVLTEECSTDPAPGREFWSTISKSEVIDQRLNVVFKKDSPRTTSAVSQQPTVASNSVASVPPTVSSLTLNDSVASLKPDDVTSSTTSGGAESLSVSNVENLSIEELRTKYSQIMAYCIAVEKQKEAVQKDNENLKVKLQQALQSAISGESAAASGVAAKGSGTFELWHVVAIVCVVLFGLKIAGFFF